MYLTGKGTQKDLVTAYAWQTIAQANGLPNPDAIDELEKKMSPKQIQAAQAKAKGLWEQIEKQKARIK
jgi:hypothetical protein